MRMHNVHCECSELVDGLLVLSDELLEDLVQVSVDEVVLHHIHEEQGVSALGQELD